MWKVILRVTTARWLKKCLGGKLILGGEADLNVTKMSLGALEAEASVLVDFFRVKSPAILRAIIF